MFYNYQAPWCLLFVFYFKRSFSGELIFIISTFEFTYKKHIVFFSQFYPLLVKKEKKIWLPTRYEMQR